MAVRTRTTHSRVRSLLASQVQKYKYWRSRRLVWHSVAPTASDTWLQTHKHKHTHTEYYVRTCLRSIYTTYICVTAVYNIVCIHACEIDRPELPLGVSSVKPSAAWQEHFGNVMSDVCTFENCCIYLYLYSNVMLDANIGILYWETLIAMDLAVLTCECNSVEHNVDVHSILRPTSPKDACNQECKGCVTHRAQWVRHPEIRPCKTSRRSAHPRALWRHPLCLQARPPLSQDHHGASSVSWASGVSWALKLQRP